MRFFLRYSSKIFCFLFVSVLIFSQQSFASIRVWIGASGTNWSNPASWSPSGIPQTGDQLVFNDSFSLIYIDVTLPVLKRLTFVNNVNIDFRNSNSVTKYFTLSSPDSAMYIEPGSTATFYNLITVNFSGTGNKAIVKGGLTDSGGTMDFTNSNTIISGNLHFLAGTTAFSSASNLSFLAGALFYNWAGVAIPTATWDITSTCNMLGHTQTGLSQSFGNFTLQLASSEDISLNSLLTTVRGNLSIGGFWSPNKFSFATNNALTLTIGGSLTIGGESYNSGIGIYPQIRLSDGTASPTINIGGNLTINDVNTSVIDFGSSSGAATINVAGNFYKKGNYIMRTGGTSYGRVNFNGTAQTLTCDSSDHISYLVMGASHVTLGGSTGSMVINKSTTSSSGSFTVNSGGILTCGLYTIKGISTGTNTNSVFTLASGGTLETASAAGITATGAGSIQTNSRLYNTLANLTYNGSSAQVSGLEYAITVNNLSIKNANVTLSSSMSVAGMVYIPYGDYLNTTLATVLVVNNGATFPNYGGYVIGPIEKVGNTAFIFPVGSTATEYTPIGMSAPAAVTDTFMAAYIHASAAAMGTVTAAGLNHVSPCDHWTLSYIGTTAPTLNVTAYWNNYNAACNNITNVSLMALARLFYSRSGNTWNSYGNNVKSGTATNGSVTWNAVTSYGTFALGVTNSAFSARETMVSQTVITAPSLVPVWPVPSTGLVHITNNSADSNPAVSAKITNAAGQLIQTISLLNKTTANATLRQNGIYFMTIINKDGSVQEAKKIVIAH